MAQWISGDSLIDLFREKVRAIAAALLEAEPDLAVTIYSAGDVREGPFGLVIGLPTKETYWFSLYSAVALPRADTAVGEAERLENDVIRRLTEEADNENGTIVEEIRTMLVDSWEGDGADEFRHNFLRTVENALQAQWDAAGTMTQLMKAHANYITAVQEHALEIANQTLNALGVRAEEQQGEWRNRLRNIATALTSAFAASVSGGIPGATASLVGDFGSYVIESIFDVPEGSNGFQIVQAMETKLVELHGIVRSDQETFREILKEFTRSLDQPHMVPMRVNYAPRQSSPYYTADEFYLI